MEIPAGFCNDHLSAELMKLVPQFSRLQTARDRRHLAVGDVIRDVIIDARRLLNRAVVVVGV